MSGLPRPAHLFTFRYDRTDGPGSWWSAVYEVRCEQPVESAAGGGRLARLPHRRRSWPTASREWEWVPDGLEAYRRLQRGSA